MTYPPAAATCIYCRKTLGNDVTGGWFSIQLSDATPWACPFRWDQLDQHHVPEIPHD